MKKVKHNIMSEGVLSPEDLLPDVTLWTLDGGQVKLMKTGIQVTFKSFNTFLILLTLRSFFLFLSQRFKHFPF